MLKIKVKAKGFGFNWAVYPVEFSFLMNGRESDYEEGEISRRIFNNARTHTACDKVEIIETIIQEEQLWE